MNVRLPIWLLSGAPAAAPSPTRLHYPVAHWIAGLGTPRRPFVLQTPFPVAQWIVCGGGLAGPVPPGPIYQTFLGAVRGALLGDATLNALTPGGYWHREAPRAVRYPLAVSSLTTESRVNSSYKSFVEQGQYRISFYAPSDAAARAAADRAVDVLTDARLAWVQYSGILMYFSINTPMSSDRPVLGYGGAKYYRADRVFDFVYRGIED